MEAIGKAFTLDPVERRATGGVGESSWQADQ